MSSIASSAFNHLRTLPQQMVLTRSNLSFVGGCVALSAAVSVVALHCIKAAEDYAGKGGGIKKEHLQYEPITERTYVHMDFMSEYNSFNSKKSLAPNLMMFPLSSLFKGEGGWSSIIIPTVPTTINSLIIYFVIVPIIMCVLGPLLNHFSPQLSLEAQTLIGQAEKLGEESKLEVADSPKKMAILEFLVALNTEDHSQKLEGVNKAVNLIEAAYRPYALKDWNELFESELKKGMELNPEPTEAQYQAFSQRALRGLSEITNKFTDEDQLDQGLKDGALALKAALELKVKVGTEDSDGVSLGDKLIQVSQTQEQLAAVWTPEQKLQQDALAARSVVEAFKALSEAGKAIFPSDASAEEDSDGQIEEQNKANKAKEQHVLNFYKQSFMNIKFYKEVLTRLAAQEDHQDERIGLAKILSEA